MRFSYLDPAIEPSFYVPLARAVEEAGFDAFVVPDGFVYPRELIEMTDATRASGVSLESRRYLEDKPFVDPFSTLAMVGGVTTRLRLVVFVLKLPIREPVLVAKQATSVAALTGDRFVLGVGTSPWREDYLVCNVPWAGRGRRADEMVEIIRGFAAGGYFEYHGEVFDFPPMKMSPVPNQPLPILVGGHGAPALRRAARLGDGWMYSGAGDTEEVAALVARIRELRREFGREADPFEVHVASAQAFTREGVLALEDCGVTDVIVRPGWPWKPGPDTETLDRKIDAARRYAESVIEQVRGLTEPCLAGLSDEARWKVRGNAERVFNLTRAAVR